MDKSVIGLILLLIIPLFFWYRVRSINRRKKSATVKCPNCGKDQRLPELQNYRCKYCETPVYFFNEHGKALANAAYYNCQACDARNFKGVITCTECGLANKQ
ncbi:MAG: hypothetical protein CMB80_26870 [Flammeovirgaceae bacterium]|nr:hypothetical protein [Flammeovirgaceae bacterium]HCX22838.1 hypothetical protein [Cytophagales bacterium]